MHIMQLRFPRRFLPCRVSDRKQAVERQMDLKCKDDRNAQV
jgi:hypothetical protein